MAQGGAWGIVEPVPSESLLNIISEETARNLQRREEQHAGLHPTEPQHVDLLQGDCDSDELIAQMLQLQFDREFDDMVKINEKKKHGLYKYRIVPENSPAELEDETQRRETEDWGGFEENEEAFAEIPRCGYKMKDGKIITKHDSEITGKRNANKVMDFPPDFPAGDGGSFDMQLSNKVFNSLKAHSRAKPNKKNRLNRKEDHATAELGIDQPTRLILLKLINNEMLVSVNGSISTGKEAIILHADCNVTYPEQLLPPECAIKVFKTTLNEFKTRDKYIKDDYRFKDRFHKLNPRKIIHLWAEKEMHNLNRIRQQGINCPEVVCLKKHILLLSFIGKNKIPAPKIKEAVLSPAQWIVAYDEIVETIHKLYNGANLIHADLSEYNILWHDEKCWIIDVSQSVEPTHPNALVFLLRDCDNITKFFMKKGVPNVRSTEELFEHITGIKETDLALLERLRYKGPSAQKNCQQTDEATDEQKPVYPFDYAWTLTEDDQASNGVFVHHDGIRDDFEELWKKSNQNKPEN